MRISAGLSVIGAIVGEFIIGSGSEDGGLGVQIIYAQAELETPLVMAMIDFDCNSFRVCIFYDMYLVLDTICYTIGMKVKDDNNTT